MIGLTVGAGTSASSIGSLFQRGTSAWSFGLSGLPFVLDFGANMAKLAGARAAWEQAVAQYRQSVLRAFQQVEDQLACVRVLRGEAAERTSAAQASARAEAIARNQHLTGRIGYSDVITAQTAALSAKFNEIQVVTSRQVAAISLIKAIGGHWDDAQPQAIPAQTAP